VERRLPAKVGGEVVYSSSTGSPAAIAPNYSRTPEELAEIIDAVVRQVLATWLGTATSTERAELVASRPSIPREIDRALLRDASDALDVYDLPDPVRYRLRDRFWAQVDDSKVVTDDQVRGR